MSTTTVDQDAMRVANRYAGLIEKHDTLLGRARACREATEQYRRDARANQESAENHRRAAREIRNVDIAAQHARAARDAEAEAAREILAARFYEAQAVRYIAAMGTAATNTATSLGQAITSARQHGHGAEAYQSACDAGDKAWMTGTAGDKEPPMNNPTSPASATPPALPDALHIAGRFQLGPGERVIGSGSVKDAEGMMVLAAAVETPTGRQIHIGVPIHEEERRNWRGAHAPTRETLVDDEDSEEYPVETFSDCTVILDAADAARLGPVAEDVITRAAAADKTFRQLRRDYDRLYDQRVELESRRFPDRVQAEQQISLDAHNRDERRTQQVRRRVLDECADRLDPADRAAYDALQQRIDAAGRDVWEPGKHPQAAAACGLSLDEFDELQALKRVPYLSRTRAQHDRLDHLGGLPPLLEQQAALICGLNVPEFRELQQLHRSPTRRSRPFEQARLDELEASPRGATASDPRQTTQMRGRYLSIQSAHHEGKLDLARTRHDLDALAAAARPLDPAAAADLDRVTTELKAVSDRYDELAGSVTASAVIPARNGGALVIEAVQDDEGGVRYHVDRKPPNADDDWAAGDNGDPVTCTVGRLRKAAKLIATLAGPGRGLRNHTARPSPRAGP